MSWPFSKISYCKCPQLRLNDLNHTFPVQTLNTSYLNHSRLFTERGLLSNKKRYLRTKWKPVIRPGWHSVVSSYLSVWDYCKKSLFLHIFDFSGSAISSSQEYKRYKLRWIFSLYIWSLKLFYLNDFWHDLVRPYRIFNLNVLLYNHALGNALCSICLFIA